MTRYYFDIRDNEGFVRDEIGLELASLDTAKKEAAIALAELAKETLPGSATRTLTIEARDERGPVLRASLRFDVDQLAPETA